MSRHIVIDVGVTCVDWRFGEFRVDRFKSVNPNITSNRNRIKPLKNLWMKLTNKVVGDELIDSQTKHLRGKINSN